MLVRVHGCKIFCPEGGVVSVGPKPLLIVSCQKRLNARMLGI